VARISAFPAACATTNPAGDTIATAGLLVSRVASVVTICEPPSDSTAVAVS
jgi:hypothetical protein